MTKATPQAAFWTWFIQHEPELFGFDPDEQEVERERLFDLVSVELRKIHPHLTFEFGPAGPTREFVISAAGIKDAFPAVLRLAEAAPTLERAGIYLFIPGFKEDDVVFQQIGYLLLDEALGEYDASSRCRPKRTEHPSMR